MYFLLPKNNQVTSKMVKEIDKNLRQSAEIQEVYEEILKSTPKDHLVFSKVYFHQTLFMYGNPCCFNRIDWLSQVLGNTLNCLKY